MIEYTGTVYWGLPSMIHFFLVGVGGGTLAISSFLILLGGSRRALFSVARYAGLIAPIAVLDDAAVLIGELGHPLRFLNIFTHVNFGSPMWIGSCLLLLFIMVSLVYAYTYLALPKNDGPLRRTMRRLGIPEHVAPDIGWVRLRRAMACIGLPLGISVCHYPGFMLTALEARPFWNTALLPLVFLLTGMATALAAIFLCRILFRTARDAASQKEYRDSNYLLALTSVVVLSAEAFVLGQIIVYAYHSKTALEKTTARPKSSGSGSPSSVLPCPYSWGS